MSTPRIGFTCSLCLSKRPLAECRLLKCYHGFCEECAHEWLQSQAAANSQTLSCPECRTPAQESHLAPLFVDVVIIDQDSESQNQTQINLAASVSKYASFTVRGLGRIDTCSEIGTVARAGKEIEKVTTAIRNGVPISALGDKLVEELVQAVNDLKGRIVPVFEKVAVQQERLDALQKQIDDLIAENKTLRRENLACQGHCEKALLLSRKLTSGLKEEKALSSQKAKEYDDQIRHLVDESTTKDAKIRRLREAFRDKEEEIAQYVLQISKNKLDNNTASSQDFLTSESDCVILSSGEEEDEPYPTPTSPSIQAKSRKDHRFSVQQLEPVKPKPKFLTDWNLERPAKPKKRKILSDAVLGFPVRLDDHGRIKGSVHLGTRKRFGEHS